MKKQILIILQMICVLSIYGQTVSKNNYNLKGDIKRIEYKSYNITVEGDSIIHKIPYRDNDRFMEFDKNGGLIRQGDYDGYEKKYDTYSYVASNTKDSSTEVDDDHIRVIKSMPIRQMYLSLQEKNIDASGIIAYDDGRTYAEHYDNRNETIRYQFNKNHLLDNVLITNQQSDTIYFSTSKYNSKDLIVERKNIQKGQMKSWKKYTYDDHNNLLSEDALDNEGNTIRSWNFRYNQNNCEIYSSFRGLSGLIETYKVCNSTCDILRRIRVENETIDSTNFSYIYDDRLNWTSKTENKSNNEYRVTEREIIYW